MNNKLIKTNIATINPWDESDFAKKLFEEVKSGFETNTGLSEECFAEEKNMKFYSLCPTAIKAPENHFFDNFHYAYSMIYGYFLVDDGIRKYKFYCDEKTFLQVLENIFFSKNMDVYQQEFHTEICQDAEYLVNYKIVEHFKKEFNIENGFCCKECKRRLDENSFSAIVKSNPGIINLTEEKYIICPKCSAEILIDEIIKDKLGTYETIYKYRLFSKQKLGEEFKVKFIANLFYDKKQSKFLKNLKIEKISDPLFQELFAISKNEFYRFWYLFRRDISNQVYDAVKEFIFYDEDQEHAEYIESKGDAVFRYMRSKKMKRINKKSME